MKEKLLEIWQDSNGKMSWQRITASLLLLVLVAQSLFGVAVSKEMIEVLKTILALQVGAIAAGSIGSSIGAGMTKPPDSPLATPPTPTTPAPPITTPTAPTAGH